MNPLIMFPLPPPVPPDNLSLTILTASAAPPAAPVPGIFPQPMWQQSAGGGNVVTDSAFAPVALGNAASVVNVAASVPGGAARVEQRADATAVPDLLYRSIDSDWQSILGLEVQLDAMCKQMNGLQGRLQSLNRDLSADESAAADNADRRDWQDARRWLRDAGSVTSRLIRDYTIGMVSAAGNRNRFEQIYVQFVVTRQPIPEAESVARDFETHRKAAQTLLLHMQAAYSNASRDAEQRAKQILSRIAGKSRGSSGKRNR